MPLTDPDFQYKNVFLVFISMFYFPGHLNGGPNINNYEARQEYMNNEQLKLMYEVSTAKHT